MGYLVISRKINERIQIGDDIEIIISDINSTRVDVAIKAPKNLKIDKKKTMVEEQKENESRNRSKS